jgi:long-subunit fatty acid transport protein
MKLLLVILLILPLRSRASLPELFGSSAASMALGNQADAHSASNNYYASALLGYSKTTTFNFSSFYVDTNFTPINNVVLKNGTNTVNTFETGDAEVNPTPTMMFGAHLSTPLFTPDGPKANFSIYAPYDRLLEADTGDPYQPRYAMYENRFLRPIIMFSGAQAFGNWSFSVGAQTGFQSNGETYFLTRPEIEGEASLAKVSFNGKPSLGFMSSLAYRSTWGTSYLSYHQEMKSKLLNRATGETAIGGGGRFPFDMEISSLLFFDPMTLRIGQQVDLKDKHLFLSLEYQHWETFELPTLEIKKRGGQISGSKNFESISVRNIFLPKIGWEHKFADYWSYRLGYFYRPSPLRTSALNNAGNTIDVDKHVAAIGSAFDFIVLSKVVTLDLAYQAHFLKNEKVEKTPDREDGDTSEPKIGSPGYRIGGIIHALSLGLTWKL